MRTDLITGEDGDLVFEGGDILVGESDNQHVQSILYAAPGHYRQWPFLGANAKELINGPSAVQLLSWRAIVARHLTSDGYQLDGLTQDNITYSQAT
jgi:hypothetical protein